MSRVIDYAVTRALGPIGTRNTGRRYGSDHDLVLFEVEGLVVGLWNPRHGRRDQVVVDLVDAILDDHELDALLLVEATEYVDDLRRLARVSSWRVLANSVRPGADEVAIVLRDGLDFRGFQSRRMARAGWFTTRGRRTAPRYLAAVDVALGECWATLAVTHFPPSGYWRRGRLLGPLRRVVATRQQARRLVAWANDGRWCERRLVLAADWNEEPRTRGRWSPHWVASRIDGRIAAPRQGTHGRDRVRA